ncbi:MAG: anthranilate synthase component II [Candidatus Zixiibacteriota bacterium]
MILVLDNYDSFTYNLVQYLGELGADVAVCRNDSLTVAQALNMGADGLLLSPGPGRPDKAGIMNDLIAAAIGKLPILGVCLGHQGIAEVLGGSITYAQTIMHGKTSEINHDGSTLFHNITSPFVATRYHSLVIDRSSLPEELATTAWTEDGTIMGIQHRELPVYGLQFHPESIMTAEGKRILANFLGVLT